MRELGYRVNKLYETNMTFPKRIATALLVCALGLVGYTLKADAQTQNKAALFVSPTRVIFTPSQKIQTVTLDNKQEEARRYDITVVNQIMNENGTMQRVESFEYEAKNMLRFVPKRFTLQPGERQTVRIMARRPSDLADGDYHSHILFREVPLREEDKPEKTSEAAPVTSGKSSFQIRALYGVAVPVVVQQGKIESSLKIKDAQLLDSGDKKSVVVALERGGNAEAHALLDVVYTPAAGGEAVPVIPVMWARVYREVDLVNKIIALAPPEGVTVGKGTLTVSLKVESTAGGDKYEILDTKTISLN